MLFWDTVQNFNAVTVSTILDKKCYKFYTLLYTETHPMNLASWWPLPNPSLISVVTSGPEMFRWPFNIFYWGGGGGGSILTVPVFGVKYSRMKHTRCIFLNIFVQDCTCGSNSRKKNNRLHGLHILRLFLTKWSFKKDYNFNTSMFFPYFWS